MVRLDRGGGAAEDVTVEEAPRALEGFKAAALLGDVLGVLRSSKQAADEEQGEGEGRRPLVRRTKVG